MLHRTYLEAKVQTVKVARQVRGQEAIGHILALVTEAPVTSASLLVTCFFCPPPLVALKTEASLSYIYIYIYIHT